MNRISRRLFLFALVAVATSGCAAQTTPYRNPFYVPREEVLQKIHTIALTDILLPEEITEADGVRWQFRGRIEAVLAAGGFKTIRPNEFESRWKKAVADAGGLYDPNTGKLLQDRIDEVRKKVFASLHSELGADGVLDLRVIAVKASFNGGTAQWDGTKQTIQVGAAAVQAATGTWTSGTVGALSLSVHVWDLNQEIVYSNAGGIQLLSIMSLGRFLDVPDRNLLKDPQRNASAVDLALSPLTLGPSAEAH